MSQRRAVLIGSEGGEYAPVPTSEEGTGSFTAGRMPRQVSGESRCSSLQPQATATLRGPMRNIATTTSPPLQHMDTIDQPTTFRDGIRNFIQHPLFQGVIAILILCNAVVVGLETDMEELKIWVKIENTFLVLFTLEFLVKIAVHGVWDYFKPAADESIMNILDFIIIVFGVMEIVTEAFFDSQQQSTRRVATLFRMFRLLRILRIFKILRFLKQLYMAAFGFALAATAVAWVTLLMVFVLYICSIMLVRTVGKNEGHDPQSEFLRQNFETIPCAMLTLFSLMAQPDLTHYRAIIPEFPMFGLFLVAFVIFGSFGMIALLTGVIGESMFEKNQLRMMEERKEREERRRKMLDICESMFDDVQVDESGKARKEEIRKVIPQVEKLFQREHIVYTNHELDGMLDVLEKGDGLLNKQDFCAGVLHIAEGIRPVSIIEIHYEVAECVAQLVDLKKSVSTCLTHLENQSKGNANGHTRSVSATWRGNGDDIAAELRGLVLELRGDIHRIGQTTKVTADARSTELTECMGQLGCLKENVDKCLGYLEDTATARTDCSGVGTRKFNPDMASVEGRLLELHRDSDSVNLHVAGGGLEANYHRDLEVTGQPANAELQRWIASQSIAAAGSSITKP